RIQPQFLPSEISSALDASGGAKDSHADRRLLRPASGGSGADREVRLNRAVLERGVEDCVSRSAAVSYFGRAKATHASPVGVASLPPPVAAITTNWRPPAS